LLTWTLNEDGAARQDVSATFRDESPHCPAGCPEGNIDVDRFVEVAR
jgi:hypothetical protein